MVHPTEGPSGSPVTALAWLLGTAACLTLAGVIELLRREVRELRREMRDWRAADTQRVIRE